MPRSVLIPLWFVVLVFGRASPVTAQSATDCDQARVSFVCPPTPYATEIGLHLGVWTLMEGGGEFGGHVTRNRNEWFAMEYGLSYRPGAGIRPPSGLASVNVRVGVREPYPRQLAMAFLTAGVAAGNSANFSVSPMVGVGVQIGQLGYHGRESPVKLRVEIQILTRGRSTNDRGRLLFGMAATFGRTR
jgi:hypothetical protein